MNMILMMAAKKSQEGSTKSKLYINVNSPCTVLFVVKVIGPLNVYDIHEIHIQLLKALHASTKNTTLLD